MGEVGTGVGENVVSFPVLLKSLISLYCEVDVITEETFDIADIDVAVFVVVDSCESCLW